MASLDEIRAGGTKWRCDACKEPVRRIDKPCPKCGGRLFDLRPEAR